MSSVQKDYSKITSHGKEWEPRKPINQINRNSGFDTETDKNGDIYLIAHSDTSRSYPNYLLFPSIYDIISLLSERRFCATNNFWWNVKFDTNAIVKMLPEPIIKELMGVNVADYEDFKLTFFPNKLLKVCKKHFCSSQFDLAQFYNFQSLKSLAHRTSIGEKLDIEDIGNINIQKIKNNDEYKNLIVQRCCTDAIICKELADQFTSKVSEVVKVNLYLSPASLSKQYFLETLDRVHYPGSSPEILQSALCAYHGGFIDALKLGTFYDAYTVDINSAYPFNMANLLSCEGDYVNDPNYRYDAAYSFFNILIDYEDTNISPLFFEPKKNVIYHANGKHDVWVTGLEFNWLSQNGFDFKVLEGRHLLKTPNTYKPFEDKINWLYDKRLEAKAKGDEIEKGYKLILNSGYGSTISTNRTLKEITFAQWLNEGADPYKNQEINGKQVYYNVSYRTSPLFNPLFAAYITAGTRVQLLNAVFKKGNTVISFNTDAVFTTKPLKLPVSSKLGEWSKEKIPSITMFGSGRFLIKNDESNIMLNKSKFRGIKGSSIVGSYLNIPRIEIIDEMLQYDTDGFGASLDVTRVKGLKESVRNNKIHDACRFNRENYKIGFNLERRLWDTVFMKNEDFYNCNIGSSPLTVDQARAIA